MYYIDGTNVNVASALGLLVLLVLCLLLVGEC